jgi:hypothetical protein
MPSDASREPAACEATARWRFARVNLIDYQYERGESLVLQGKCKVDTRPANRALRDAWAIANAFAAALITLKALVGAVALAAPAIGASQIGPRSALSRKPMPATSIVVFADQLRFPAFGARYSMRLPSGVTRVQRSSRMSFVQLHSSFEPSFRKSVPLPLRLPSTNMPSKCSPLA